MQSPEEIAPGVWLFHIETTLVNYTVVLQDGSYLVVGPYPRSKDANHALNFPKSKSLQYGTTFFFGNEDPGPEWDVFDYSITTQSKGQHMADFDMSKHQESLDLPLAGWQFISPHGPGRPLVFGANERVLFCGSMLSDVDVPALPHGSQEYLDSLARVEQLDPKLIVPSRGVPARGKREIRPRIERDREYIHALRRRVETSHNAGVSLTRAIEVARSIYEDYPFVEQHFLNVRHVWDE